MSRVKVTRVDIDPYGSILYFTTSRKEFKKLYARYTSKKLCLKDCDGVSSDFNSGTIQLVGVFDDKVGTMAHEFGHLIVKLFATIGVKTEYHNSEPFCYLLGHLMDRCYPYLKKNQEK